MNAVIAALSRYAMPIAGAAILACATAFGVQTYRIGQLQQDKGRLAEQINSAVRANRSNQQTIKALVTAAEANAEQFERAEQESKAAGIRAAELESQLSKRAGDDIAAIQDTDDACGLSDMPNDIRLRIDPNRNRDGRGADHRGTAGSGGSGADPTASPARD